MLPLSPHQFDVLRLLRDGPLTVAAMNALLPIGGFASAMPTILRVLNQRGMVAYVGGRRVKLGKGAWRLTEYGISALRELGELPPA